MPKQYPSGFDVQYLEMGRTDIEAGKGLPLNPRDRNVSDYRLADTLWLSSLATHLEWIAYQRDLLKPPPDKH